MSSDAEQSFEDFERALKKSIAALRDADIPFLLGGSFAAWARGGPESRHDLDLVVKPEDAERALEALEGAGMRGEHPPEEWLLKAWEGDVLVDVIFEPRGIEITDEVIERGDEIHVLGITMPVMAIEDVLATKLMSIDEHELDYSSVLKMARALREQIDWRTVRRLTGDSPYARAFFVLVEELGIASESAERGADVRVLTPREERR
jgi:Nucleotidyl transferase of unknown function (DUF2204)